MINKELVGLLSEWLGVIAIMWILSTNARFQRRQLVFLYPRRDGITALVLSALLMMVAFIFYMTSAFSPLLTLLNDLPVANVPVGDMWRQVAVAVLGLLMTTFTLTLRNQPLRHAGWGMVVLRSMLYLTMSLIILSVFLRAKVFVMIDGFAPGELTALLFWLVICLAEETVFRGFILPRLGALLGERVGLALTALIFAIWRLPRWLLFPETAALNFGLALGQGLVLGWIMQKSGHVLVPALYRTVSEWLFYLT